jgi:hypothetical protein
MTIDDSSTSLKSTEVTYLSGSDPQPIDRISEDHLVISPYTDLPHLLYLPSVGTQEQLLAHALTGLKSEREDYATAPYVEIFNWEDVILDLKRRVVDAGHSWNEQTFYIVVFRSRIPPTTDYADLGALDKAAHVEAVQSGGFLK